VEEEPCIRNGRWPSRRRTLCQCIAFAAFTINFSARSFAIRTLTWVMLMRSERRAPGPDSIALRSSSRRRPRGARFAAWRREALRRPLGEVEEVVPALRLRRRQPRRDRGLAEVWQVALELPCLGDDLGEPGVDQPAGVVNDVWHGGSSVGGEVTLWLGPNRRSRTSGRRVLSPSRSEVAGAAGARDAPGFRRRRSCRRGPGRGCRRRPRRCCARGRAEGSWRGQ
jgi:hypothetical protein